MTTTPTPTVPPTDIEDVPSSPVPTAPSTEWCQYGFNADGTCFVIRTWENITPEQYEATPMFTGFWPWCEPGLYPSSYKWEAPCGPDPCQESEFGNFTLWEVDACSLAAPVAAVAAVGTPPVPVPECSTGVVLDGECQPVGTSGEPEAPATVAAVAAVPMTLPETGPSTSGWIGGIGTFFIVAGIGMTLVKRWERQSRSAR